MSLYEFGPFQLDAEQLLLLHDGAPVALGPKVVATLLALIEHPGEVLAKTALLDRIWPEGFVEEANLAQNIYVLRKTLKPYCAVDPIETVPRRGYRFVASVRLVECSEAVAPRPAAIEPARRGWVPSRAILALAAIAIVAIVAVGVLVTSAFARPPVRPQLSSSGARLYAIGRYYWNLRTRGGVEKSLAYFAQVIDADPHDASGYAALAEANATMSDYHYGPLASDIYLNRARAYAGKALALNADSGEAYAALGFIAMRQGKWAQALQGLRHALVLAPSYGPAHEWYGIALLRSGHLPAAFRELKTAADLDPLSVATTAWLGSAAYLDRRYNEAIAYSRQTLDLDPHRWDVYQTIGLAYEAQRRYARAVVAFERLGASCSDCRAEAAALLAHAYAEEHQLTLARSELAYAIGHDRNVDPADLAIALNAIGERRIAFSWLRRVHGTISWTAIANDPRYDAMRDDAGFRQLSQGAG